MSGRLEGKVAIVTGAASGFGKGVATKFAQEGAKVVLTDITEESGQAAAADLKCDFFNLNVTSHAAWKDVLKFTLDKHGQLDVIVNNAGACYTNKPTEAVTEEEFDLCINVNLKSLFQCTNALLPYFLENSKPGCFIQVSSTAAIRPRPNLTWYNCSKAAVSNATKSMAVEYGPKQIRFNAVCPVVGVTGMTHLFIGKPNTPENMAGFVSTVPLGRPSMPADVANACCYIASDEASFITGVELEVDGGRCV